MRLTCKYKCDTFPVSLRIPCVSLIKDSLKKSNSEYYEKLYNYQDKANKQSKNFCFAVFLKDYKLEGDVFKINGEVILNISSPDAEFMIYLYNGLLRNKHFKYKEYQLTQTGISLIKEKEVTNEKILIKTLSPIYVKDKDNIALAPFDDTYEQNINYISNIILANYRGYGLKRELLIKPVDVKKTVVKEEIRDFHNQTSKKYIYLTGYKGVFALVGDVEDINDIYKLGIGFRRNQGWGMIDLL